MNFKGPSLKRKIANICSVHYLQILPFSEVKYEKIVDHKSLTCENHTAVVLFSNQTLNRKDCEEVCNNNDECYFMFHTEAGWCSLYKICQTLEETEEVGSTFRKLSGKVMC